ncbi:MAG: hypothetical protein A2381_09385 [Bdellovibrionales bacterium RIFOXYB1_FULL_37_110]|nr:MAG: hypothetical protein A2381_09385 [Bdellovibrionales bacterium RIFOXYB1_FULL_37_110]OFZ64194.1 MAG: hypothetical protein A2577_12235 [Bdellovibrionales bacterium RIFOXYD1_FULL_36_51]OGT97235.1 MAG: hypothetical protein A2298_05615 [Gammaproteobacteria bacterium RIFOXYB2_FULL_38_6]
MLSPNKFDHIYFFRPYIDFRKGHRGLAGIVQDEMKLNPFEKYLFIFCNKHRDRIKALYWDNTGFVLWYKCLEKEKFRWPSHLEEETIVLGPKVLKQFLQGFNPWELPHKKLNFTLT